MNEPVTTPPPLPPPASRPAWPFWTALSLVLLPAPVAAIGGEGGAVASAFVFAPLGGLAAGILLGVRLGSTPGMKLMLSFIGIFLCLAAAEGMASVGCAMGNFKLNVH